MSENFADRLLDAIDRTGAPVCVGIDPIFDLLPLSMAVVIYGSNFSDLP